MGTPPPLPLKRENSIDPYVPELRHVGIPTNKHRCIQCGSWCIGHCEECEAPLCRDCQGKSLKTHIIGRRKCRECRASERLEKPDLDMRLMAWYPCPPHVKRYTHFKQCGQCFKDYGKERKWAWKLKRCEECGMPVCEHHSFHGKYLGYHYKLTVCFYCFDEYEEQHYPENAPKILSNDEANQLRTLGYVLSVEETQQSGNDDMLLIPYNHI